MASPPLAIDRDVASAFTRANAVVRGMVVSETTEWWAGSEAISEAEVRRVKDAYVKFTNDKLMVRTAGGATKLVETWDEWHATPEGKRYRAGIRGKITVKVRIQKVEKGNVAETIELLTLEWPTGLLTNCNHVMVPTSKGSKVVVFLNPGWGNQGVIDESGFTMSDRIVNPADT